MSEQKITYTVYLTDLASAKIDVPSIGDVKEGFWITEKHEFTKGSDSKYWIPPSRILYVEK